MNMITFQSTYSQVFDNENLFMIILLFKYNILKGNTHYLLLIVCRHIFTNINNYWSLNVNRYLRLYLYKFAFKQYSYLV